MFSELKKSIKLDIMIKERNIIFGNHLVILNTKNMFPKLFENIDYTFSNPIKTNIILGRTNGTDDP